MSSTHSRKTKADQTGERLLELAWKMVQQGGLADFTMRELATRGEVAVGLPFAHFGSRDGLIDELRLRAWDRIDDVIAGARGEDLVDPEAGVRRALRAIVDFALAEPNVYDLVTLVPGMALSDRVLTRELRTAKKFIGFLYLAQERGHFRFAGDPVVFGLALWTSLQGYVARMRAQTSPVFKDIQARVLDELLETFFARIRTPAPEPR